MNVRASGSAPLARRMPDPVTGAQMRTGLDPVTAFDVHVKDYPARAFVAIAVQVLDDLTVAGTCHQPIRHRRDPVVDLDAALGLARRGKVQRAERGAEIPGQMRTAGECPDFARSERQEQPRLGLIHRDKRLDCQVEGRTKEQGIGVEETAR